MSFLDVTKDLLLRQPIKKDGLLRQSIVCYEIAQKTYDFVMTYVGNCTINMTLVLLFLVSSVVRAFAHGATGRQINPLWWTH